MVRLWIKRNSLKRENWKTVMSLLFPALLMNKTEILNCFKSTFAVLTDMKLSILINKQFSDLRLQLAILVPGQNSNWSYSDVIHLFKVYKLFHLSHTVIPISRISEGEMTGPG